MGSSETEKVQVQNKKKFTGNCAGANTTVEIHTVTAHTSAVQSATLCVT